MKNKAGQGYKVWHLLLAVVALGLVLRVALGAMPVPDTALSSDPTRLDHAPFKPAQFRRGVSATQPEPSQQVQAFNLKGEVHGTLLSNILKTYMPESTSNHADTLRDTLPPSDDPRMIVILPSDKPVY